MAKSSFRQTNLTICSIQTYRQTQRTTWDNCIRFVTLFLTIRLSFHLSLYRPQELSGLSSSCSPINANKMEEGRREVLRWDALGCGEWPYGDLNNTEILDEPSTPH